MIALFLIAFIVGFLLGGAMASKWFNEDIKKGIVKDKYGATYKVEIIEL